MLAQVSKDRVQAAELQQFERWVKEHVDPRLQLLAEWNAAAPCSDVEYAAVLDKAISPFIYWLRDQPSSVSQTQPVAPAASASLLQNAVQNGGSLSNNVPQQFKDKWGLYSTTHDEAKGFERLYMDRFLGPDYKAVESQLKAWGFVVVQEVEGGKSIRFFERRINQ